MDNFVSAESAQLEDVMAAVYEFNLEALIWIQIKRANQKKFRDFLLFLKTLLSRRTQPAPRTITGTKFF